MSKHKFKPGDIVIGNEKANKYGITNKGYVGKVLSVDEKDFKIECDLLDYWVDYDCFDLYEPANKPSKKNKVIELAKENKALKAENEKLKLRRKVLIEALTEIRDGLVELNNE